MATSKGFPLRPDVASELERAGEEFLAEFLWRDLRHHPGDLTRLVELGALLTRVGRYEDGLRVDRELVGRAPEDPTAHYNLACSLALLGQTTEALDSLERAVELGYDDAAHLLADDDLRSLRDEERFGRIVRGLGGNLSSR